MVRTLLTAVLLTSLLAQLPAHGGRYRGGWNTPPAPSGSSMPGGPASGAGPTTGARPTIADGTSWQVWWEFNKDPELQRIVDAALQPVTGSDDFYLGDTRRRGGLPARQAVDAAHAERIAEALVKALRSTDNRDITTAAMIGLAKLGRGPSGVEIRDLFVQRLADGNQEVREAAALALGIAGQPAAIDVLGELLGDTAAGRKVCGGPVSDRTRTFAAWSLGLLAQRVGALADKQRIHDLLLAELSDKKNKSRDLRVGLIQGLGLLGRSAQGAEKMLLWRTASELWEYYDRDLGKGDQLIQSHVPIAIARLLGRGTSSEHRKTKQRLLVELDEKTRRHQSIRQSAAMALGTITVAPEVDPDEQEICAALEHYYLTGSDQLARFFSALALGRIGGTANRRTLLRLWPKANRAIERPWLAIALGLIAQRDRRRPDGVVDEEVGRLLEREFRDVASDDTRSALAVAIGLTGYAEAADALLEHVDDVSAHWQLIGYVSIGLALLDHQPATDKLMAVIQRYRREPFIVQQASLALARLADVRTIPMLHKLMAESDSLAELATLANALGLVGDRSSVDPMIEVLHDKERPNLARAFAAAALGGIGDKDVLPWNTLIAVGMNYMATVDTLTNGSTGILDIL